MDTRFTGCFLLQWISPYFVEQPVLATLVLGGVQYMTSQGRATFCGVELCA